MADAFPAFLAVIAGRAGAAAMAEALAEQLVLTIGACSARVYFKDRKEGALRLLSSRDGHGNSSTAAMVGSDAPFAVERAASTGLLELSLPVSGAASCECAPSWLARGAPQKFALPLTAGGTVVGALCGDFAGGLSPRDVDSLAALGPVIGAMADRVQRDDEARDRHEWTRVFAHEIRQPLHAVSLAAGRLLRSSEGEAAERCSRAVLRGVMRADRLIEDFLDGSLLGVESTSILRRPTDLVELVGGFAEDVPRVVFEVRGEIPLVAVDADRIGQVVANLLANAEKYGDAGSKITLVLERRPRELVVSVTNDGGGIAPHERSRIFERFQRAHDGTVKGWGIGLYVCRALVAAHGGAISVDCEGGATCFSFTLPLSE